MFPLCFPTGNSGNWILFPVADTTQKKLFPLGTAQSSERVRVSLIVPTVPMVPTKFEGLRRENAMSKDTDTKVGQLEDSSNHALEVRVHEFVEQLTQEFGRASRLRKRICAIVNRTLPRPKGGRPALAEVTQAIDLRRKGLPWKTVYARIIADHSKLSAEMRQFRQLQLRDRVRSRLYWYRRQNGAETKP